MVEEPAAQKRGNRLGFWLFKILITLTGLRGAYGFLYFVCLYYLIFDRQAYSSSMSYVKRRFKRQGIVKRTLGVYRIFINQGKNLIDRLYYISGMGTFDIEIIGYDKVLPLLKNPDKGFVLLTAHVGNWQVTMNALGGFDKVVHLLMRPEDNIALREALDTHRETEKIKTISTESFLGGAMESVKALDKGDIVSIMGDRPYGGHDINVELLGEGATLPHGAFSIAASVGCPVVVLLSPKVSYKKYLVDVSNIIVPKYTHRKNKKADLKKWVREFANIMEDFVDKYPYQWYVFRDLWADGDKMLDQTKS